MMVMNKREIEPKTVFTTRLVKSEDLNHHGTLFAGRTAEWFVESGFIAAASLIEPKNIVCLKIHGMHFSRPAYPGQIMEFASKIVYAGKTSIVAHVSVIKVNTKEPVVSGFITFINVDETTKSAPHFITVCPLTDEDKALHEAAKNLGK